MSCQGTVFPSAWCQFSVSPSLDSVPAGQNCSGKWLPWPPNCETQQSCFSFTLPDILCHRLLVTFFSPCADIQSIFRAASMFFLVLQLFHQIYTFFVFLSVVRKCVCLYVCPFVILSIFTDSLFLTSIGRWQFSWVPLFLATQLTTGHLIASLKV